MFDESSDEVFSLPDVIEAKFKEIDEKIKKIEEENKIEAKKWRTSIRLASNIIYHDGTLSNFLNILAVRQKIGDLSDFDGVVTIFRNRADTVKELINEGLHEDLIISYESQHAVLDYIFYLAHHWGISFQDISTYLIEQLKYYNIKESVEKTSILKHYGAEALRIWESL